PWDLIDEFEDWNSPDLNLNAIKSSPMNRIEIEDRIKLDCQKVVLGYRGKDYETIAQSLYQTYLTEKWFNTESMNIAPGIALGSTLTAQPAPGTVSRDPGITRESQEAFIAESAMNFQKKCEYLIHEAIAANLNAIPGWKGKIQQWIYDKLGVHFGV
ncbi:MAG TPA: hypothetical protein PLR64_04210, partial [Candidatus Dojkabacteria bacterium]|nr:hypothetical protein [Candidatus Dojkabacteria bacterium]